MSAGRVVAPIITAIVVAVIVTTIVLQTRERKARSTSPRFSPTPDDLKETLPHVEIDEETAKAISSQMSIQRLLFKTKVSNE